VAHQLHDDLPEVIGYLHEVRPAEFLTRSHENMIQSPSLASNCEIEAELAWLWDTHICAAEAYGCTAAALWVQPKLKACRATQVKQWAFELLALLELLLLHRQRWKPRSTVAITRNFHLPPVAHQLHDDLPEVIGYLHEVRPAEFLTRSHENMIQSPSLASNCEIEAELAWLWDTHICAAEAFGCNVITLWVQPKLKACRATQVKHWAFELLALLELLLLHRQSWKPRSTVAITRNFHLAPVAHQLHDDLPKVFGGLH